MMTRNRWFLLAGLVALTAVLVAFGLHRGDQVQHFTARVERGDILDNVEATGTINAIVTVQVGSQVSGTIARLNADFNSRVKQGDVIALIEPALFQGALLQAKADLENARANLVAARANLEKARSAQVQTKADYDRAVGLTGENIMSQQQLDQAKASNAGAVATVGAADANVTQAMAQVSQKEAAVSVAQTNLDYTVIRSPIDGTVVARNVDVGQTVAASLQAPTIFTIAQDLTKMLVYAKTDESDVGNIRAGKPVTFKVDAFPKETFQGVVTQVRMNATTVQNVVTYDTIIEFSNPDMKLYPGMTAYVTIPVATARSVLKVPNAALRYKPPLPPEEVLAAYRKHGIETGGDGSRATVPEIRPGGGAQAASGSPPPPRATNPEQAVVWLLRTGNAIEPIALSLGITDHAYTEVTAVLSGSLKEGDELVIRSVVQQAQVPAGIRR